MARSRRAVTILMASHLYWLQTKCLMALKGVRNHRRLVSGRLEGHKHTCSVTQISSTMDYLTVGLFLMSNVIVHAATLLKQKNKAKGKAEETFTAS